MARGRKSKLHNISFVYKCNWACCQMEFCDYENLKVHQLEHFRLLIGNAEAVCGICSAVLSSMDTDAIERHSYFHSWTIQLKVHSSHILLINDWPQCFLDTSSANSIPELPTKFECGWKFCDFQTNDVYIFISHSTEHCEEYNDSRYPPGSMLKCLWEDCTYVGPKLKNLKTHINTHTQRKRAVCPSCGLLFVGFNKLEDHLKRQQVIFLSKDLKPEGTLHKSIQPSKCSRCKRVFSSRKFLVTHMRRHINTVKCPLCDFTFSGKSALDRHMLFRHSNAKDFKCPYCESEFKLSSVLSRHIEFKHTKLETLNEIGKSSSTTISNTNINSNSQFNSSRLTSIPIHGPLAQAGATCLMKMENMYNVNAAIPCDGSSEASNPSDLHICPYPNCGFTTDKQNGLYVHITRKHKSSSSLDNSTTLPSANHVPIQNKGIGKKVLTELQTTTDTNNGRLYVCHICSVVKKRGTDLSKHLIKSHSLARPSGHVRFTYTLSDDGNYRLQLTRLDTISVATELLGENIVSKLLVDEQTKL